MSPVISKIFGRGHGAKNSEKSRRKKDSDPQEGTVTSPATPKTIAGTSMTVSSAPPSPPEQLWDLAYDNLKADECSLVKAYEKILSCELDENASRSEASELQESEVEQTNPETRRSQMSQLVQAGLKKTERQAKVKQSAGEAMQVVLSAKETIGSAIQSMPQAALAWAGVCLALQVSLFPRNRNYGY